MNDSMYIIRYALVPEEPKQTRLDEMLKFCDQSKVDEVMFFILPEEYNRGQYRPRDYEPWLEFAVKAKEVVEKRGLKTSLNPWFTTLHCDRGRRSEDLKFRRMVLDTGYECLSVGCPLCEDWRKIFFDTFGRFAEAGFKRIWIEDDFRFHNHNSPMGWGGCFCGEHIKTLQEMGVRAKDREELIKNLNAKGLVHPDRKIWMNLNAQTYIDLAKNIRSRMDKVDPEIKLGLMTSHMAMHTIEGRDWSELVNALGGPERAMVRPHACSYSEACHTTFFQMFGNLSETLGTLPAGTKTFFEIENAPMSQFAKSNQQTAMQMAAVIEGGCDGLSLDVLDFLGTGSDCEPEMAPMLANTKEKLLSLREIVKETQQVGIRAILPTDTGYHAHGKGKPSIPDLPTVSYGWSAYLGGFGYPCINQPKIDAVDSKQIYALAGDAVYAIPDEKLRAILQTNIVLMDADAARIIVERKMGDLIGITKANRHNREESSYSFEEAVTDQKQNIIPVRASVNLTQGDALVCSYELTRIANARTVIKDCYNQSLGAGCVTYRNSSGGRGLILPYRLPAEFLPHVWARKHWLDEWLTELAGGVSLPFLTDGPWVHLAVRSGSSHKTLFLANQMFEIRNKLHLRLSEDFAGAGWKIELHSRDKKGSVRVDGDLMTIETELAGNDWLMLVGR
jgi:uncharacterized protein YqgV (UPF0045/DUF77 family)